MARQRISRSAPALDRISNLPDDFLIHILSFLTTKESVATSILSKRWVHLWHHVPNLIFPNIKVNGIQSNYTFNEFLFSVLIALDTNFINTFHLHIHYSNPNLAYHLSFPNVTKWINLVVQCKLEHLHLHLDNGNFYKFLPKLPTSIFTCRTLVSLNLCWFRVKGFSFSVNGIQLRSLKSLRLVSIKFLQVNDFVLLLAGSPILEDLEASDIHFYDAQDYLTIQEYKNLSFPKLTRAHTSELWCDFPAKAFSNSESLSIDTIMYTNEEVNRLQRPYSDIYIFHNLTNLEIHDCWYTVLHVLHVCPKLQILKLCQTCNVAMWDGEDDQGIWEEPEFIPRCLFSYLTTCIIQDFLGWKNELRLAGYILRNAQNLQTMTIKCESAPLEIERKLSQFPKASATCQLSVFENISGPLETV